MDGISAGAGLLLASQVSVGAFLVPSAIKKLADPFGFRQGVREYHLLPRGVESVVGATFPWMELAVGAALMMGLAPAVAGGVAAALMIAFIAAMAINLLRGRDLDCHCYGVGTTNRVGQAAVARNLVLLGLSLVVVAVGGGHSWGVWWSDWWRPGWLALASPTDGAVLLLLTSTCIGLVYLLEWGLHVRVQAASAIKRFGEALT
ncbi:MAG: MauE/DoxX family redox-associated membrane protein [Solirubrobacteraceae bacterium]